MGVRWRGMGRRWRTVGAGGDDGKRRGVKRRNGGGRLRLRKGIGALVGGWCSIIKLLSQTRAAENGARHEPLTSFYLGAIDIGIGTIGECERTVGTPRGQRGILDSWLARSPPRFTSKRSQSLALFRLNPRLLPLFFSSPPAPRHRPAPRPQPRGPRPPSSVRLPSRSRRPLASHIRRGLSLSRGRPSNIHP